MLEHLHNPQLVVSEIQRVLKPQGLALILLPSIDDLARQVIKFVDNRMLRGKITDAERKGLLEEDVDLDKAFEPHGGQVIFPKNVLANGLRFSMIGDSIFNKLREQGSFPEEVTSLIDVRFSGA